MLLNFLIGNSSIFSKFAACRKNPNRFIRNEIIAKTLYFILRKVVSHIIFLSLLINLSGCKKNQMEFSGVNKLKSEFNQDVEFRNWLKKHKLEKKMFIDSLREYDYTLWGHSRKLYESDNLHFKEYSSDSSYVLISNFDNTLPIDSLPEVYSFSFINKNKSFFYYGLDIINDNIKVIDYHWLNDNTFMILYSDMETNNQKFHLTEMKMEVDSMWYYVTN